MPLIQYVEKKFRGAAVEMIDFVNTIIEEYQRQGFKLTLRQLYYQCVARDKIPNTVAEYKRLGSIVNDARLAGMVDWDSIEDRTRNLVSPSYWNSPAGIISSAAYSYNIDMWDGQPYRVECWIEKEALAGVFDVFGQRAVDGGLPHWGGGLQSAEDVRHLSHAVPRCDRRQQTIGEWIQADSVEPAQAKIRKRRGKARRIAHLGRVAQPHRGRQIEKNRNR